MEDIRAYGGFRICPSGCSMEVKWFAENLDDAMEWGNRFYGEQIFYVVTASIPSEIAKEMFYNKNLDNIGSAICIDEDFLDQIKPLKVIRIKRR
ncbi:hypothetical protein V2H45_08985 [Tumidithrix elongata RA019]|uniref:Uncharacterized protein n=1 Tax=Tumidithrix elongata BACA0141 TaxID=2716417 RepID=A0AAW9PSJ0_9CYAN|nr:hypothetical protein [Tumidithrix elongata RA019]